MKKQDIKIEDLEELLDNHFLETRMCAMLYEEAGINNIYKNMLKSEKKVLKEAKKQFGKEFDEMAFKTSGIGSKIDLVNKLLQWQPIMSNKEDREIIANELIALAEELKSL